MKTLKSIWWLMLLMIIFKVYGLYALVSHDAASAVYMKENQSLLGVTFLFVPLSVFLFVSWMFRRMFGRKKSRPGQALSDKNSLNFEAKSPS